jgi:hypothetical protein
VLPLAAFRAAPRRAAMGASLGANASDYGDVYERLEAFMSMHALCSICCFA